MLKFKILILLSINCIYVYCCQRDNDCGTSFYKCSFNNFQISQGIGYDNVEKKVVVFGKFDGYIQPSIISIYDNGTLKEDYQVLSDSYTVYQHITGLKYYNQKSKISYLSYDLHRGPGVGYFNPNNNTQRIIYSGPYPAYVFQDDINSSYIISTPVGSYKQSIYDTLQTKTQQLDFRSYWFTKENNSIFYFMLGNENEVRRFDDSCTRNCQSDLLFNLTFTPSVFEKSPTHFYFGNSTILYKFYLNGTVANTYSIPNLNSIVFNQEKNKLYLNTGSSIKVLVLLPNGSANIQTVYSKLPNVGICCKNDVECGYGVYSVCEKKEFEIYPGIGYSNEDNKVYLLGRFNTSSELKYIVSISGDGVTSLTGEFPVLTDSFTDAHTTQELLFYNQNTNTPFLVSLNRNFYGYGPYFKVNNTFNYVWTTKYYPLAVYYDDQDTYLVNNYLQKINKNGTTFVMLKMPLVGVRHLWTVGDYLYFIHRHTIGRIDKSCIECNQMETLLSLPFTPYAFERSSTHFYFGVTSGYFGVASDQPGLYELPINGPITSLKKLLVNSIQGLVFNREKTKLFISTTDNTLFRIDQLPGNPVIIELHSHNNGSGTCICNSYFSGTDCKKCFSDNVVSNNGTLSCEFKSPSEYQPCYLDSQCLNKKLSYCEGFCKCRNSFSGINCDICSSGNVTTDRGIERCEV